MKLLTNAGIYLGANLLSAAIPFLLLPFLTRALSPAEYGIVAMLGVSLSIFTIFTGLNLNGAVGVRYFQLGAEAFREFVCVCVLLILLGTGLVALAVWSGGGDAEFFGHIFLDIAALTAIFYLTGGYANTLIWAYLLPLIVAAIILPSAYAWVTTAITIACYAALIFWNVPLEHVHDGHTSAFNLHLYGMWLVLYSVPALWRTLWCV